MPTFDERSIVDLYQEGGLLAAFAEQFDFLPPADAEAAKLALVETHNRGAIDLLALVTSAQFEAIGSSDFFHIQHVYIAVIPRLSGSTDNMMQCVDILVKKAGNDLAANFPYNAFRAWCSNDLFRPSEIVAKALSGEELAIDHLSFALEILADLREARRIALAYSGNLRLAAITALGRIPHDQLATAGDTVSVFKTVAAQDQSEPVLASILAATPSVLRRVGTLEDVDALELLASILRSQAPGVFYYAATGLSSYPAVFTMKSRAILFEALLNLDPTNKGTVDLLDVALGQLMVTDAREQVTEFIKALLIQREGNFQISDFDSFGKALADGEQSHFCRTFVSWMGSGDRRLCQGLSSLLQSIENGGRVIDIPIMYIPIEAAEQVFLARKVVGYFFIAPVTAASVVISILRAPADICREELEDLLFDPLQINYGGDLSRFLSAIPGDDPAYQSVQRSMERRGAYIAGLDAAGIIKEPTLPQFPIQC